MDNDGSGISDADINTGKHDVAPILITGNGGEGIKGTTAG